MKKTEAVSSACIEMNKIQKRELSDPIQRHNMFWTYMRTDIRLSEKRTNPSLRAEKRGKEEQAENAANAKTHCRDRTRERENLIWWFSEDDEGSESRFLYGIRSAKRRRLA